MTDLVCKIDILTNERLESIRMLLGQISGEHYLSVEPHNVAADTINIIARTPGHPISVGLNSLSFHSTKKAIMCHYSEIWQCTDAQGNEYRLENLHFHLLEHRGPNDPTTELIAFHWHRSFTAPNRRPHLHFSGAPRGIAKAHLVSTLGVPTSEQATVQYLDELLGDAVGIMSSEVLTSYA